MAKVGVKNYRPDWIPFFDYDIPIETKTWWCDLLKNGIQVNTGETENDRLATSIDELVKVLKGQAGKTPNVTVTKSPEEMTMWEDMKKSWKQIQEDLFEDG